MGTDERNATRGNADQQRITPYLSGLFGYAYSLTGETDGAHDLVQSCALKALTAAAAPLDEMAYRTWLFRILRNAFIDNLRKERQEHRYRDAHDPSVVASTTWNNSLLPDVSSSERRMLNVLAVREGMGKLEIVQREILILVDVAGFSYQETADLLHIPLGTVMSRLSRARRALLVALEEEKRQRTPRLAFARRRK